MTGRWHLASTPGRKTAGLSHVKQVCGLARWSRGGRPPPEGRTVTPTAPASCRLPGNSLRDAVFHPSAWSLLSSVKGKVTPGTSGSPHFGTRAPSRGMWGWADRPHSPECSPTQESLHGRVHPTLRTSPREDSGARWLLPSTAATPCLVATCSRSRDLARPPASRSGLCEAVIVPTLRP